MKILALITDGFGAGGGIGQYNRDLLAALSRSPNVSEVRALPRNGSASAGDVPVRVTQLAPEPGKLAWMAEGTRQALGWRPDAIFCGHINAAPFAAGLARLLGRPLWVQAHGFEAWTDRGPLVRRALEQALLVTAVSRHTRSRLLAWCDLAPERVRVLPNTVAERFAPRSRRPELVARYGLDGRRVILTVGRLAAAERYKGHARIIEALPAVALAVARVSYLIVGGGDDQAALHAQAAATGVADRVIFTGPVPAKDLPDYFALADVFAMPSTGEGFGIAFLEAARMGLPVIGGRADGSCDALADGRIGRLVDPHDPDELAGAVIDALTGRQKPDPEPAARFLGANFKRHVDGLVQELAGPRLAGGPAAA